MTEKGHELGWVAVGLNHNCLQILAFSLASHGDIEQPSGEDAFFLDTLMRAAASYGETKGASCIETISPSYNAFLKTKGFQTDETHAFTSMSTIVHYISP